MSWIATAIVGSAVIGGVASNRAASKAAKGQERALGASSAATDLARTDVKRLFGQAGESRKRGFGNALDFISGSPSKQIVPFQRGNVLAQEQVSRGLPQIQNALLGLPVDLSEFTSRSVGTPESFNFDLSRFTDPPADETQSPLSLDPRILRLLGGEFRGGGSRDGGRRFLR